MTNIKSDIAFLFYIFWILLVFEVFWPQIDFKKHGNLEIFFSNVYKLWMVADEVRKYELKWET